jgi:hypothetical protein
MTVFRASLVRLEAVNPLLAVGVASALLLGFVGLLTSDLLDEMTKSLPGWGQALFILSLMGFIFIIPIAVIAATAVSYARAHLRLRRLVFTYLALILLFTDVYFACVVFDDRGGSDCTEYQCKFDNDIPMQGVQPVWMWLPGVQGRRISLRRVALAYVDCFHYSVITGSTVGFGDIRPSRWYSKLLTDVQVLLSLGLTVLAVSRFFGQGNTPGPKKTGPGNS